MQRILMFLFAGLVSGALTGCPEKKADKEPPATPEGTSEEQEAADEPETEAAAADQKKPEKPEEKQPAKAEEKADEGGW